MSNLSSEKPQTKKMWFEQYKSLIYTVIFGIVFLVFFLINNSESQSQGPLPENTISTNPIDFQLSGPDGNTIKLSDYRGKVVLLDFWATWCPPCRKGIPDLIELKNKFKDEKFEVIGVSVDRETKKDIPAFIKSNGVNYPIVYADDVTITAFGGIEGIPTVFLIDKEGKIASRYVGLNPKDTYITEINRLLGK